MSQLGRRPEVVKLAHDLGLPIRGNCLSAIRDHALAQVQRLTGGFTVDSLDALRRILANRLRARVEFIHVDDDVDRIATEYANFSGTLRHCLRLEFLRGDTEGITLEHENPHPGEPRYLAVIDARGERRARAYFTAWHEITHLLVLPPQLAFAGLRRTPLEDELDKDPIESVVDHIAGHVAFYAPLVAPTLHDAHADAGALTFGVVDAVRRRCAPEASLFATASACVRLSHTPAALVWVEPGLKRAERRRERSPQTDFDAALGCSPPEPKLRIRRLVANEAAAPVFGLHPNMRVPARSALSRAHASPAEVTVDAAEDRSWWETSTDGPLAPLALHMCATRRGPFVYGLIELAQHRPRSTAAN